MSKVKALIKEYGFNENESIKLSDEHYFNFSNTKIISYILDKKANKIKKMFLLLDKNIINSHSSYIDFVSTHIKRELYLNINETKNIYNKLIECGEIVEFHKNVEDVFIINEISEIICFKLLEINKNYLTSVSVFHSTYFFRLFQTLKIELRDKDVELHKSRKSSIESTLTLIAWFLYLGNNNNVLDFNENFGVISIDKIIFDKNKNLKENVLSNLNEFEFYKFIKTKPSIIMEYKENEESKNYVSEVIELNETFFDDIYLDDIFYMTEPKFLNDEVHYDDNEQYWCSVDSYNECTAKIKYNHHFYTFYDVKKEH